MSKLLVSSEIDNKKYEEEEQVVDKPELGIYDTRVWDRSYN